VRPYDLRAGGKSELRQDHAVQRPHRLQPARGQFPRRDGGSENGQHPGTKGLHRGGPAGHILPASLHQEEIVTRDFILNQKPDGIINIVDATNIERNLYLTLQLMELKVPMVLALNMMDEVRPTAAPST
jgi:hypothetical protein